MLTIANHRHHYLLLLLVNANVSIAQAESDTNDFITDPEFVEFLLEFADTDDNTFDMLIENGINDANNKSHVINEKTVNTEKTHRSEISSEKSQ